MKNRVVIIGNGFDINLGLPTSYRDFIDSAECKSLSDNQASYLINRIINNYKLQDWVDIEEELKALAKEKGGKVTALKKRFEYEYDELVDCLQEYLKHVTQDKLSGFIRENSIAADFLRVINEFPHDYQIFSFNYTDLNDYCKFLKLNRHIKYEHVHGSIKEGSIILGFEDSADNIDDFSYMIKTFHPSYSSHHLRQALSKADEVIFFGISLGSTDYHYFSQFFREKSIPYDGKSKAVKITFVTANNQSHIDILEQLRNMNDSNTNLLFDQNDIEFLYSNDSGIKCRFYFFLQRLRLESLAYRILTED